MEKGKGGNVTWRAPVREGHRIWKDYEQANKFICRLLPWSRFKKSNVMGGNPDYLNHNHHQHYHHHHHGSSSSDLLKLRANSTRIYSNPGECKMELDQRFGKYGNHNHHNHRNRKSDGGGNESYPMVSFVNKGDGSISMDLMESDQVLMVNENELYSMGTTTTNERPIQEPSSSSASSPINNSINSLQLSSSLSSRSTRAFSLDEDGEEGSSGGENSNPPPWFCGTLDRETATARLLRQPIGSFLVRESASKPGSYALSLRVPKQFQSSGVAHYLIIRTTCGTFKIKVQSASFTKEFSSLDSLIIHHSIMQELLPVTLNLSKSSSLNHHLYNHQHHPSSFSSLSSFRESDHYNHHRHLLKTESRYYHEKDANNEPEELLVDIDSDPDYQRILNSFRRTMANCK